jgi:hypothetical protein
MIYHKHITVEDFRKVGLYNEYWLWYFTPSQIFPSHVIQPIEGPSDDLGVHAFKYLIEQLQIPVFESKTQESMDFLISLDPNLVSKNLYYPESQTYVPIILGFNYMRLVSSTHHPKKCFCFEGIIEIVGEMNPEILKKLILD